MHGVVRGRHPSTILPAVNNRATLGYTLRLRHRNILRRFNIAVVNTATSTVSGTRSHHHFSMTVGGVNLRATHSNVTRAVRRTLTITTSINFPYVVHPSFAVNNDNNNVTCGHRRFRRVYTHNLSLSPAGRLLVSRSLVN